MNKSLEQAVLKLQKKAKESPLSLEKILKTLSGKGRSLIIIILSLPFCQPLQIPGLSLPFGLVIAFFGLRIAFGKQFWLPQKLLQKKISYTSLKKSTDRMLWVIRKIQFLIHPRILPLTSNPVAVTINGLVIFLLGILLALPLPIPLSNMVAAWGILLMGLGMFEEDGVFVIASYVVFVLTVLFFVGIALSLIAIGNHHE